MALFMKGTTMKRERKVFICSLTAAAMILSGCAQEPQVVENGGVTTASASAAAETTTTAAAETTTGETTTTAATTTAAEETTTTEETTTAPETTPETTEETTASTTAAVTAVVETYTGAPATAAPVTRAPSATAAATAAPAVQTAAATTQSHVSGYRYGSTKYAIKHDLEYMKDLNSDFIGWLTVPNTPIDLPVVQASDNKFYLEHDFYGAYDNTKVGTTFADCHVPVTATSGPENLVIYGHNIRTGVGLAKITNYYPARYGSLNFYLNNPIVTYESVYGGQSQYVVFAGMFVNTETKHGNVFNYYKFRNFGSEDVFNQYFEAVFDRSVFYNPDLDIKYGDKILTLSTCYYPFGANIDTRFVVFARQVRSGETLIKVKNSYTNPSPLYFDYYYKVNGGSWAGRKWPESLIQGYSEWKKTH